MSEQPGYFRQFAVRAVVMFSMTYVLEIGGTYNGVLEVRLKLTSLVLLTLGVTLWLAAYIRHPLKTRPWSPLGPAIGLWGAALAISSVNNLSGRTTIGLWYIGLYLGLWLILSDLRQRGLPGRWITDGALLAALPIMLIALVQVLPWYLDWFALPDIDIAFVPPRPSSVLGNPNAVGIVMAVLIPFAFVHARWAKRRLDQLFACLWIIFAFVTLYLTLSRGAWIGAAAGLTAQAGLTLYWMGRLKPTGWHSWWQERSRQVQWSFIFLSAASLVILLVLMILAFDSFNTPRRGSSSRLAFYEIAANEFSEHPLTGTGLFTFGFSILENRSVPPEQPHAHAHNLVLNVASELGLPGLVALSVTVLLIVKRGQHLMVSQTDPVQGAYFTACCASLVAFGVHSLFDMPMMMPGVMMLAIGILAGGFVHQVDRGASQEALRWRIAAAVLPPVLWIFILVTGWWSSQIYMDYVRGEQLLVNGDYWGGAEVLRGVAEQQPNIALYYAEYAYATGLAAYGGDTSLLQPGIDAYRRALELEPPHAVWWANLAVSYGQAGESDQALEAMQQATQYAPNDPDIWLNMGTFYEERGMVEQARAAYQRVLELNSHWAHSSFWEFTDLRREIIIEQMVPPTPYQRAEELWQAGLHDAALIVLTDTIDRDPTQPAPYTQIARLYLFAGDLNRAEDYLQAARALAHVDVDLAWIYYVESEIARVRGDYMTWDNRLADARRLVLPDVTGYALFYSRDVAQYQFLRLTVQGVLLPQLTVLWPDPVLLDLLQ